MVWEAVKLGDYINLVASKQALSVTRAENKKFQLSAQQVEILSLAIKVKDHFLQKTPVFPVAKQGVRQLSLRWKLLAKLFR